MRLNFDGVMRDRPVRFATLINYLGMLAFFWHQPCIQKLKIQARKKFPRRSDVSGAEDDVNSPLSLDITSDSGRLIGG